MAMLRPRIPPAMGLLLPMEKAPAEKTRIAWKKHAINQATEMLGTPAVSEDQKKWVGLQLRFVRDSLN